MTIKHVLDPKRFLHIGIVVKDIAKATKDYSELWGLGEWTPFEYGAEGEQIGTGVPFYLKLAVNAAGPIAIELIEPVGCPDSIWQKFLDENGEGIHHFAYRVDDIEKTIAELVEKGGELLWNIHLAPGMNYCYVKAASGLIVELVDFDVPL
ncbi:VOC family protein [Thalassotalea sp. PLHSN55]|uniref:VOC family protein n=1 Tax=Thalassotalea sp. PLHSN55 TaxID=3435888 RepID=UPI003F8766E4